MIPSINELRLIEENHRLRIRIQELERKNIVYTPAALPEEFPVTAWLEELPAFIRVRGNVTWHDSHFELMALWEEAGKRGFHQVLYKADYAELQPESKMLILEQMLRQCIQHIIAENFPE